MKKIMSLGVVFAILIISSCSNYRGGELTGVPGRAKYFEPDPFGMIFVPQGSYTTGMDDQDVPWSQNTYARTVTVDPFWMDETEITNNEYRQFVYWVRDSIMRRMLGEVLDDFVFAEDQFGNPIDPPALNWDIRIDFRDEEINETISELYYNEQERLCRLFYGVFFADIFIIKTRWFDNISDFDIRCFNIKNHFHVYVPHTWIK